MGKLMSTSVLKALPGKLDIKRHSPSILYLQYQYTMICVLNTIVSVILSMSIRGKSGPLA